jgi:lipoprotein-releasing system permease protein
LNTSIYIAKRYLFSKKQTHAINIISGISMLGVLVGSAALIIILSVFNGLEQVILSLYSNFTPELKIEPRLGKTFDPNTPYFNGLGRDVRVVSYTQVLQEKALIKYADRQFIGTIKGVSDDFLKGRKLDSTIQFGSFTLKDKGPQFCCNWLYGTRQPWGKFKKSVCFAANIFAKAHGRQLYQPHERFCFQIDTTIGRVWHTAGF